MIRSHGRLAYEDIARILDTVRGTASKERVHIAALRCMGQARYEADSAGHYALHFDRSLHFTSPNRCHTDLDVHRALKGMLQPEPDGGAGRDAEALACCAILKGREGDYFQARIASATESGLFIRLESPVVNGLVPMRTLVGRWELDPQEEALIGPRGGSRLVQAARSRCVCSRSISTGIDSRSRWSRTVTRNGSAISKRPDRERRISARPEPPSQDSERASISAKSSESRSHSA